MALDSLHELYVEELKDLYNAENQLVKALPKMVKAATHPELKNAFNEHLEVTRNQIVRLETIFEKLEESPKGKKCKAMEGLVAEAAETWLICVKCLVKSSTIDWLMAPPDMSVPPLRAVMDSSGCASLFLAT